MFTSLNNKGYMLIEMILASVIAFTIAYFAIDMTIKIKNKNDDLLVETLVATDQAIYTNELMNFLINNYSFLRVSNNFRSVACTETSVVEKKIKNKYIDINYNYKGRNNSNSNTYSITTEDCFDNPSYTTFINNHHLIVKQLPDKNFDVLIKFRHYVIPENLLSN